MNHQCYCRNFKLKSLPLNAGHLSHTINFLFDSYRALSSDWSREMVDLICICREEPLLRITTKFSMRRYENIVSIFLPYHKKPIWAYLSLRKKTYLLLKTVYTCVVSLSWSVLVHWSLNILLISSSAKMYFIVLHLFYINKQKFKQSLRKSLIW